MSSKKLSRGAIERLIDIGREVDDDGSGATPGFADLGRYRLQRELGRGGMGRVYAAEDTQLGRIIALKLMPETVGLSEVMRRRFAREAQAVAKLNHPNIAAVYDATPDYIAMQFVDGCSILEFEGGSPRLFAELIRDAALAVQYAHERGVVHRDLKPSNLMVEVSGGSTSSDAGGPDRPRVFVLDFGLAKETSIESSLSTSGSIVGTPAYMPPEQAEGRGQDVDARSDVYGLGATLYACLTGRAPFPGEDMLKVLRSVVEDEVRSPRVESDLDAIVLKCLAKEPERRYGSARELGDDLTRWLDGEAVVAKPPSATYRLRKFLHRRRSLVRVGVIAVAASAAISAAILFRIQLKLDSANTALSFSSRMETSIENAGVLFRFGEPAAAESLLDGSIAECQQFLIDVGDVAHVYYLRGRMLRMRGKRQGARVALDRAIQIDGRHVGARLERGLLLLSEHASLAELSSLGDQERSPEEERAIAETLRAARADLAIAAEFKEDLRLADIDYALAELQRLDGNLDAARVQLLRVLELEPSHGEACLALSRLYFALGDAERGRKYAAGAVDLRMGFAPALLARSESPVADDRADPIGTEVVLGRPRDVLGLELLVMDFSRELRRGLAGGVVPQGPQLPQYAAAAGRARSGELSEAISAWQQLILDLDGLVASNPQLVGARINRGVCRAELERVLWQVGRNLDAIAAHRSALSDFDAALEQAPDEMVVRLDRGMVRLRQGQRLSGFGRFAPAAVEVEQAIVDFDEVERAGEFPARALVARGRARELWSRILTAQRDGGRAEDQRTQAGQDYDAALVAEPNDVPALRARASWRLAAEDVGGATEDLERALELTPGPPETRAAIESELAAARETGA